MKCLNRSNLLLIISNEQIEWKTYPKMSKPKQTLSNWIDVTGNRTFLFDVKSIAYISRVIQKGIFQQCCVCSCVCEWSNNNNDLNKDVVDGEYCPRIPWTCSATRHLSILQYFVAFHWILGFHVEIVSIIIQDFKFLKFIPKKMP